jgi:hypothetical protein
MGRAAAAEIAAWAPDAVIVKADLTDTGKVEEYDEFLSVYGALGDRLHHVRGNHDAIRDPSLAICDSPYTVDLPGVTLAVLDTTAPGAIGGTIGPDQLAWLDDLAATSDRPLLVFGHHPCGISAMFTSTRGSISYDDTAAFLDVVARRRGSRVLRRAHAYEPRNARRAPDPDGRSRAAGLSGCVGRVSDLRGGLMQVMRRTKAGSARCGALPTHDPRSLRDGARLDRGSLLHPAVLDRHPMGNRIRYDGWRSLRAGSRANLGCIDRIGGPVPSPMRFHVGTRPFAKNVSYARGKAGIRSVDRSRRRAGEVTPRI